MSSSSPPAKKCLITKGEMAKRLNIAPQTLVYLLQNQLAPCVTGQRVDWDNWAVKAYRTKKGLDEPKKPKEPEQQAVTGSELHELELSEALGEAAGYMDMTLRQLAEKHGTATQLKDFLDAVKTLLDIEKKDMANNEASGKLISRDFVKTHVLSLIETSHSRLLNDAPKTITATALTAFKAGSPAEKVEEAVRKTIGSFLSGVKEKAKRNLEK